MSESYSSAGVYTTETDLSQPTLPTPSGIPAGVIGTAESGPAFVPITVRDYSSYNKIFGGASIDPSVLGRASPTLFGPLAVYTYLENAQALTYIRVLGVGDGLRRDTGTGQVNRAGFTVGGKQVQDNGIVGNNKYAVASSGDGVGLKAPPGRTYFLGCFLSESNGSNVFREAGLGLKSAKATAAITLGTSHTGTQIKNADTVTITDTRGVRKVYQFLNAGGSVTVAGAIKVAGTGDIHLEQNQVIAAALKTAIDSNQNIAVSVGAGTDAYKLTLTQEGIGKGGNVTITSKTPGGTVLTLSGFSGGDGGARPIIRGVLMAPSGVIPALSGGLYGKAAGGGSSKPDPTVAASEIKRDVTLKGGMTGSVNLTTQNFVLLLNGYTDSDASVITASFDMTAANYFANVLNTDPTKIEEKGHLLYAHFDIEPAFTVATGSGVVKAGSFRDVPAGGRIENIGFLVTGSNSRNGYLSDVSPNYESFSDRFAHPKTPFFISQDYGGKKYDLFRVHTRGDGSSNNSKYKISIQNIVPHQEGASRKFGTFDVIVRHFTDSDAQINPVEQHLGCNLDPSSEKYIARVIGDRHTFFDFDQSLGSQKLVTVGDHAGNSPIIRVELNPAIDVGNVPEDALPLGFRGPDHLVTSGSGPLATLSGSTAQPGTFATGNTDVLKTCVVPPLRYRADVKKSTPGSDPEIGANAGLYWGVQFERRVADVLITDAFGTKTLRSLNDPGATADSSLKSRTKFFPGFYPSKFNFSVGNNPGVADVNGTVLDCDRFNNNLFSLEKIRIKTGSSGDVADPEMWNSASYIRDGNITSGFGLRAFKVEDLRTQGNRKYAKFTTFMQGGFDGTNIFRSDLADLTTNACKREIDDITNQGGVKGATVASYRKAIDIMGVKSDVNIHLLAIPGIRHASVTDFAMDTVEDRFDALYIMDIEQRDKFNTVMTASKDGAGNTIIPNVTHTAAAFAGRALDNSFGAAYFPDVVINIEDGIGDRLAPPSVAVMGAIARGDNVSGRPYLAPAGFSRAALDKSIDKLQIDLEREDFDKLYQERLNPLVAFAGQDLVVWGQKTLQMDASALDRINVRRLLIYIRRQVKAVANSLLFEPNREETLEKFNTLVKPIMQSVQDGGGVSRYKVIIDTTTTTQADVENNTIRGKIFLQPTRTAEFVALDFTVANASNFDSV